MASEESAGGSGASPGVLASLRALAANLIGVVQTRFELLANELEEERIRTLQIIVLGAVSVLCAAMGLMLLTAWLVIALWEQYRFVTLAVLGFAYFAGAAIAYLMLKARAAQRSKMFSASLAELRRDRDLLNS